MNQLRRPDRRVALVTGVGRPVGIGAAICRRLAEDGFDIAFSYWSGYDDEMFPGGEPGFHAELTAQLEHTGVRAWSKEANLAVPSVPGTLVADAVASLGPLTALINNACVSEQGDLAAMTSEQLDRHYAVNVRGTMLMTQAFLEQWPGSLGGRVVSMSTGWDQGPMAGEIAYAATKGAVEAFTKSAFPTLGAKGITINAVNPGPTETGWMTPEFEVELAKKSPFGRVGQPIDAARLIAFLCSEEGGWITGQVIHSEGGFTRF